MNNLNIKDLLYRYESGTATAEEKLLVELWYHQEASTSDWQIEESKKQLVFEKLKKNIHIEIDRPVKKIVWFKYAAAASLLLVLSFGLYFAIHKEHNTPGLVKITPKADVNPGRNKAILTLANGKQVILDDTQNGLVANQGKAEIRKTSNGTLIYNNNEIAANPVINKLSIPRGGQYQVTLPDGTKVWLNSATTLSYPTAFGGRERRVELNGEAYFEVAHNPQQPFIVKTDRQEVKVLGTHFNINAYEDEREIKTTLMEGSVQINYGNKNYLLKPDQQAIAGNGIQIDQVDAEIAIDWKNGIFDFNDENLPSLMRKISRWYNVEVIYQENLSKTGFGGEVSRSKKLSDVLKVLEITGAVHFKIEGRRVTVMK